MPNATERMDEIISEIPGMFGYLRGRMDDWQRTLAVLQELADDNPEFAEQLLASETWKATCFPRLPFPDSELYCSHALELGNRVINGEPLPLPTNAEIVMALHHTSINGGPLVHDAQVVYEQTFIACYAHKPELIEGILPDLKLTESYQGAAEEVCQEIIKKLLELPRGN